MEAFAGASAGVDGKVAVGGVGATGRAEVQAGIGVSADVNAGIKDGKLKIGGEVGACLGLGGKVSFDVEIDPKEVTKTVSDGANKVGQFLGDLF